MIFVGFVTLDTLPTGGAVAVNVLTWWRGLPSSSSQAPIGGPCGAALIAAFGGPVSTTHVVSSSIMSIGAADVSAVNRTARASVRAVTH